MRDVSIQLLEPREILERIPDPARFRPTPRIRSLPPLRDAEGGGVEVKLSPSDRWRKVHPMLVAMHESMRGRETTEVETLVGVVLPHLPKPDRRVAEHVVRNFLMALRQAGHVDIPFDEPPAVFAGRYERVKELGRGGMGIVHLCRDRVTGGLVVVKHSWGWSRPIERAEATNRKEADVLRRLDHPRIPPLVDAFEVDGLLHMVRAFAPGTPIMSARPKSTTWTFEGRVAVIRGLAEALHHVHERGYLYLDMKPANVILESREKGPMLLDFGVCVPITGDETPLRHIVGSRGYCAPELRAKAASRRADVFSLGRTWHHLASGHRPRVRHTPTERDAILAKAGAPAAERALIARLTSADPGARPADMREVLALLP